MTISALTDKQLDLLAIASGVHRTWARTFHSRPQRYFQPSTLTEIQEIVASAIQRNQSIVTVGSGHSPSTLTMNDKGWILNLDKFNRVTKVVPSASGKYTDVTAEAGMRVYQLNEYADSIGLAVQSLGSISDQSLAGIISTGTHGSSAYHGLVSNQVVNFTLLDGNGELIFCSETENPEIFQAGLCSLGKLGIIVYITYRLVPKFNLKFKQQVLSFEDLVSEKFWPDFWFSSEFIRVWWYPYTEKVVLWRADRTDDEPTKPIYSFYGTRLGRFFYEALLWVSVKIAPSLTPAIERWVFGHQYGHQYGHNSTETTAVAKSVDALNMDCLFSQFVNEWALPLTNGLDSLRELKQAIETGAQTGEFYVHSPVEVRISNTSFQTEEARPYFTNKRGLLEQSFGDGKIGAIPGNFVKPYLDTSPELPYSSQPGIENLSLNINATIYRPFRFDAKIDNWYRSFEAIMWKYGGKPHWAKNFLGPGKNTTGKDGHMRGLGPWMNDWYGPRLEKWKAVRKQCDPRGVFIGNNNWAQINGLL